MRVDGGLRRVDADGEVVGQHAEHPLLDRAGAVAVGDHLVVGDQDEGVDARVLDAHPVRKGAEVVAEVQVAGGPVAGHHAEAGRVLRDLRFDLGAPCLRPPQRCLRSGGCELFPGVEGLVGHGCTAFVIVGEPKGDFTPLRHPSR